MQSTFYFTAVSLCMFQVPSTPIIRSTYNYSYSHWYKTYISARLGSVIGKIRTKVLIHRAATSLQRGQLGHVGVR